jgi:hypothetical protein
MSMIDGVLNHLVVDLEKETEIYTYLDCFSSPCKQINKILV